MEVNGERFRHEVRNTPRQLFKSPNCVVCGTSLCAEALRRKFGLRELTVTTMQSISGRGDAMYSGDRIVNNVMPLHNSIRDELRELLGLWYRGRCSFASAFTTHRKRVRHHT